MWHSVLRLWRSAYTRTRSQAPRRRGLRLRLERLEDRLTPSTFNAATVSDLIADINTANNAGGSNTIALTAGKSFTLTEVNNTTDGRTGLPVIAANDNLTIQGNGDTVARSTASGTPAFRLFDVAPGASLTLQNLTVQGGLVAGIGAGPAAGGGIYNQGSLVLAGVTVQNNTAQGHPASGGGIWSNGALTLEGGTRIQNNLAKATAVFTSPPSPNIAYGGGVYVAGGTATLTDATLSSNTAQGNAGTIVGRPGLGSHRVPAGSGYGGGIYIAAGSVTLQNDTLSGNTASGGQGGPLAGANGGNGFGGGLYAAGGSITLQNDSVSGNNAKGGAAGPGGRSGLGEGGGLYIDALATVYLDAFTVAHISNNTASTSNNDIFGSYSLTP